MRVPSFAHCAVCGLALTVALGAAAAAPETTGATGATEALKNKKFQETDTLVDPKLRAAAGSLSRYSVKADLGYRGPSVGDWSQPNQPNPDGTVGNYAQSLRGDLMLRYRTGSDEALSFGTGVTFNRPFNGEKRFDASTPFLSYEFARRFGDLQINDRPGIQATTTPENSETGEIGAVFWANQLARRLGRTRVSLALESELAWWGFSRPYAASDGRVEQSHFATYPYVRCRMSDSLYAFTSLAFSWWHPRSESEPWALLNRYAHWRSGIGISIGRDAYIAPFFDSYLYRPAWDSTTFNVSTIFSLL